MADSKNPLDRHLTEQKLTEAEFAALCTAARGWKVHQSQVSMWRSGYRKPGRHARDVIAKATGGAVKPEAWG